MPFPDDFSNVTVIKIHPAIGIARVSKNDDFFIHGTRPETYKSNGLMKRQAVQFRLFAYGEDHVGLGELTPDILSRHGIVPVWRAKVANRKVAKLEREPLSSQVHVIKAEASSDDANGGLLTGSLSDFAEGATIPLGQIRNDGVFVPPKAGVFRKTPGIPVPNYPNFTPRIADTSSDGFVTCSLSGSAAAVPVLAACIVVAPGDYSPDVDSSPTVNSSLLVRLKRDITGNAQPVNGTLHNLTARNLDEAALKPCTADFAPGFEVSFGNQGEVPDIRSVFHRYERDEHIAPEEIRVRYAELSGSPGAVLGQLTSGCCSPWQTDFTACTGYWSENLPTQAFLDENDLVEVSVYRREYADHGGFPDQLENGDDFEKHQDKIGVVRVRAGRLIETERDPGDDLRD